MSNELANLEESLLPVLKNYASDVLANLEDLKGMGSADYLARLQFCAANSEMCKDEKIDINSYAWIQSGGDYQELGPSVDILVIAGRKKAMAFEDQIISSYDSDSEVFQTIVEKSKTEGQGYMWGPEFLVWIPKIGKFAGLFMGGKSTRRTSSEIIPFVGKMMNITSKKVPATKNRPSYMTVAVGPSQVSCDPSPTDEELRVEIERFRNPPEASVEIVSEENTDRD